MILKLAAAAVALLLLVGTERMVQSLITIFLNLLLLFAVLFVIFCGAPAAPSAAAGCVLIFLTSIFYQGGVNEKTTAAFLSVLIVMALTAAGTYWICWYGNLQGFPVGQYVSISEGNGYTQDIPTNMLHIQVVVALIVMLGSAVDTAVSVSSALYEVHRRMPSLGPRELYRSGIRVGKDIVSSSMHTLFFIFFAEYLTLFIYLFGYSDFWSAVNSKELVQQVVMITIAGIASVLVIPITSEIASRRFSHGNPPASR